MTSEAPLSLCIINGYPKTSRRALALTNVTQAHNLYLNVLKPYLPNAAIDLLYIADLDANLPAGTALTSYDGYIWTGSDLTIYHNVPEVTRQIEFCKAIYESGRPQYGSCWGVQIAAVAAGGEAKKNPKGREWSLARDITLTEAGQRHPMYAGKPHKFDGFIMHLDEVTKIPQGGTLLACNEHTYVQALEVKYPNGGQFWATQYHPEFTLFEMARLIAARKAPLTKEGFFTEENEVETLAQQMIALSENPQDKALRRKLNINDDILNDTIRQTEVKNWLEHLVIPLKNS